MKLQDVPKDDANVLEGKTSFIQYAVDTNGDYVQEKSPGFEPQNIALEQAWDDVNENTLKALKEVEDGNKSPLYYFMHREIMELKILSEYMNMSRWKVKRHMKPSNFKRLEKNTLEQYANVLRIEDINDLANFDANKWRLKK